MNHYAGRTLTMIEVFNDHNVDTPYIKKNYKRALQELEAADLITVAPHRKNTFADRVTVTFKSKES